jgi:hypothetical protein
MRRPHEPWDTGGVSGGGVRSIRGVCFSLAILGQRGMRHIPVQT